MNLEEKKKKKEEERKKKKKERKKKKKKKKRKNLRPPELEGCVKVEVDVLGSPSLTVRTVSVDVKQQ